MSADKKYEKEFSEDKFWSKIKKYAKKAGYETIEMALILYYTLKDSKTPTWAQGTILGSLGYFISPIDAILDVVPVVGYTDDLAVLGAAFAAVAMHITQDTREKAKTQINEWFGDLPHSTGQIENSPD